MRFSSVAAIVCVWLFLFVLPGCGGKQPPIYYYQLATEAVLQPVAEMPELVLGVGPVTVPEILKRQEVAIRGRGGRFSLTDEHRWVGVLEKDLTTAVMENLGRLLTTEHVLRYPWESYSEPKYRIEIEILELVGGLKGPVDLRASWTVFDASGRQVLIRKISQYELQTAESSVDSMVATMNQLLLLFSTELSQGIAGLEGV